MKESKTKTPREKRKPSQVEAISCILFLLLAFGLGAAYGLNYVPLMVLVAGCLWAMTFPFFARYAH